mmetsp:Transcript_5175/g.5976  ORF Transcript_5175/g.5976 Transcript_5175/m.5976 type:complete len:126 (+) Transcript_5175:217-594(+)
MGKKKRKSMTTHKKKMKSLRKKINYHKNIAMFSGSAASSVPKRIPAPLLPPVPLAASYVPLECQAKRIKMGAKDPSSQLGLSMQTVNSSRTAWYTSSLATLATATLVVGDMMGKCKGGAVAKESK